jgi:hypothetical protein
MANGVISHSHHSTHHAAHPPEVVARTTPHPRAIKKGMPQQLQHWKLESDQRSQVNKEVKHHTVTSTTSNQGAHLGKVGGGLESIKMRLATATEHQIQQPH